MALANLTMSEQKKKLPDIKREKVAEEVTSEFQVEDSKGKLHDAKEVTYTEKEIDSVHLVKIAPMYYFCTDNNKVLMIPFSIQFSATEFLRNTAGAAIALEKFLEEHFKKNPPPTEIKKQEEKPSQNEQWEDPDTDLSKN